MMRLSGLAIHGGLFTLAWLGVFAVLRRPFLSLALVLSAEAALALIDHAKRRALREPLVHSDIALFSQAVRHPRLYLPYLPVLPAVLAALAFVGAAYTGWKIESPVPMAPVAWASLAAIAVGALAWGTLAGGSALRLEPEHDIARFGLIATLWHYRVRERQTRSHPLPAAPLARFPATRPGPLPHIVAVQCESFFDARRLYGGIASGVLDNYDALCGSGVSGRLEVPAWGAYTMRTEFGFLSGIGAQALGVHRFNPYRYLARRPVPTLASWLRALGYRSVCVHPYAGAFFGRERVMPNLGFDEFLDARAFGGAARAGPYVADAEVARKVAAILDTAREPTFVFAITIENHGPLHLERATQREVAELYRQPPPAGCDDLTVYLRHLRNADAMLGELAAGLARDGRDGVLCAFGDHVPSMPRVYRALNYADASTDYVLWRAGRSKPRRDNLAVEALAAALLGIAELDSA